MKHFLLLLIILPFVSFGQVGIGTTNPSDASMLEVSSSTTGISPYKGFMPPRIPLNSDLSTIPAGINDAGLQVYVLETGCLNIWNGVSWIANPCSAIVTGSEVQFSSPTQSQAENVAAVDFIFTITNPSPSIPIQLSIAANVYDDIDENTAQTVTIPAGVSTHIATGVFTITNDIITESNEDIIFTASVISGGLGTTTLGSQSTNTLTIVDDDSSLTLPFVESFETDGNGVRYATSIPEDISGMDYFSRARESDLSGVSLTGSDDGDYIFAAQDIDGLSGASSATQTLTISGIDITSGAANLIFEVLLAEDDNGSSENWDGNDYVHIDYQIDGGGYQNLLWVEGQNSFNNAPQIDTDFDGIGDGLEITSTWQDFSRNIPNPGASGVTLDIRITISLDAGDEDIAIDFIKVTSI